MRNEKRFFIGSFIVIFSIFAVSLFAAPFKDNGNGTVTDIGAHLLWQKCSMGQNNNASCSGEATSPNWYDALKYCTTLTLDGYKWRLPNVNELNSIVDKTISTDGPAIYKTKFPNTVAYGYWSSTNTARTGHTSVISFFDGSAGTPNKTFRFYVRCVSTSP